MERQPYKQSLLNLPVAGDVDTATDPLLIQITGLMPIKASNFISVKKVVAAAEVVQVYTLDGASAVTVVAGRKYKLLVGNPRNKDGEAISGLKPIGYTAPSTLTGTAALDRANLYISLAYKINQNTSLHCTAYHLVTLTHAAGVFVVGETLTGATTGATGIVISAPSGTSTTVAMLPGSTMFAGTENLDDESGSGPFALVSVAQGVGVRIVDDADYYNSKNTRVGATTVMVVAGFTAANLTLTTAAVYSQGQGTRMLQDKPIKEVSSDNLAQGKWSYPANQDPVAGETYTMYIVSDTVDAPAESNISNSVKTLTREQIVWADDDAAGYAAFDAAILAL